MEKEKLEFIKKVSDNDILRQFFSSAICDYIACQFALESDFGKSPLAKYRSNYCGMKKPYRRLCYIITDNIKDSFATYIDLEQCITDYIARFFYFTPNPCAAYDLIAFKNHIQNTGYCPENDYLLRIEKIYNQFINHEILLS